MRLIHWLSKADWRFFARTACALAIAIACGCGDSVGSGAPDMSSNVCTFDSPQATFDNCLFSQ